ncbi:MAG: hypothetical protein WBY53_06530 [Acidobacteriaceae bacterium]
MSSFFPRLYTTFALVGLAVAVAGTAQGQAKLVPASTPSPSTQGWHNTAPDRLITAHVRDGVLMIDGMVGKVQLNYVIERTGFMYFFVPGVGTAVVSMGPLAGGVKVVDGFDGDKLAFSVEGHSIELSSDTPLLSKRKNREKADIYVRMDHSALAISRYPKMGYGDTTQPPYVWPLSAPEPVSKEKVAYVVTPPPLPKSILPQTASTTGPGK